MLKTSLDDTKETALREALAKATATASEPSSSGEQTSPPV